MRSRISVGSNIFRATNSLRDVVDFYDQRFSIALSHKDKTDLVNFLNTL
jgi:hypothetical protein